MKKPAPAKEIRLQKLLSQAGVASRRKAEELIQAGKVRVNGRVVTELGTKADPHRDQISVAGRPLPLASAPLYVLLHKPVGVLTTLSDPEGRPTVRELLTRVRTRVFPVGRLDYTSSGLLLLTNDGELAMRLMHPRYGIEREYRVKTKGVPDAEALATLGSGVSLDAGRPASARVTVESVQGEKAWLRFVVREGKKHEVRRLCAAVGLDVEKLRRVRFGPLELGSTKPGEYRQLELREVEALRRVVGLPPPLREESARRRRKPSRVAAGPVPRGAD